MRMLNERKTLYSIISLNGGSQIQYIMNSDKDENLRGFKFRPKGIFNTGLYFVRNQEIENKVFGISAVFTGLYALLNSTSDDEKDTYQFRGDISYYFPTTPAILSIGATYLNGSDPYTALARQQYFLIPLMCF